MKVEQIKPSSLPLKTFFSTFIFFLKFLGRCDSQSRLKDWTINSWHEVNASYKKVHNDEKVENSPKFCMSSFDLNYSVKSKVSHVMMSYMSYKHIWMRLDYTWWSICINNYENPAKLKILNAFLKWTKFWRVKYHVNFYITHC